MFPSAAALLFVYDSCTHSDFLADYHVLFRVSNGLIKAFPRQSKSSSEALVRRHYNIICVISDRPIPGPVCTAPIHSQSAKPTQVNVNEEVLSRWL